MEEKVQTNKMATMPVPKLMLSMGIPMILSMMLQALYNIVDSAFVSNMAESGEQALNALTLAFPMQMLMVAIGVGTGVGVNALAARCLGQGNKEKASEVSGNALFLGCVIYVVFLLFGLFGVKFYIGTQTDNPEIYEMAVSYLQICCTMSMGIVFYSILEKLLQATGNALYSTIAQVAGAITNIIMDPILIYGLLGFPEMGVQGAAYATVIGQLVSFALALIFHLKVNKDLSKSVRYMKPSWQIIKGIYTIGLPAIIAQALMPLMTYALNVILVQISEQMVTAYGLFYKIQQFILFAAFGLRDAITPVVSYSYGMNDKKRIRDGIKFGMLYTAVIMLIGTLIVELLANPLSGIFGLSGETQQLCIEAMRVIGISFILAGANVAFQGVFQALNGGTESLVVSVCRQLIFVLPVAWGLTQVVKATGLNWVVWLTFPFAELVTVIIAFFLMRRIQKKINF